MSAIATLTTGLVQNDTTQATQIARGSIALTATYGPGATSGDLLNLALYDVQSNAAPVRVLVYEMPAAGTAPTGYLFGYEVGSTPANGRLSIMTSEGVEYTQGSAYSAALLAAALFFEAIFTLGT